MPPHPTQLEWLFSCRRLAPSWLYTGRCRCLTVSHQTWRWKRLLASGLPRILICWKSWSRRSASGPLNMIKSGMQSLQWEKKDSFASSKRAENKTGTPTLVCMLHACIISVQHLDWLFQSEQQWTNLTSLSFCVMSGLTLDHSMSRSPVSAGAGV